MLENNVTISHFSFDFCDSHPNGKIAYVAVWVDKGDDRLCVPFFAVQEYRDGLPYSTTRGSNHACYVSGNTWFIVDHIEKGIDPRTVFTEKELLAIRVITEECFYGVDLGNERIWQQLIEEVSDELGAPVFFD